MDDDIQKLEISVSKIVAEQGLELFGMTVKPYRGTAIIELFVDRASGGITMDECANINQVVVAEIEQEQLFDDNFSLEVSSPGIDWPLKNEKDFRRVVGYDILVEVRNDKNLIERHKGKLFAVDAGMITIQNDTEVKVALEDIAKAEILL